jgi:hypothetical protein
MCEGCPICGAAGETPMGWGIAAGAGRGISRLPTNPAAFLKYPVRTRSLTHPARRGPRCASRPAASAGRPRAEMASLYASLSMLR